MGIRDTMSQILCAGSVLGGWERSPGRLSIRRAALGMGLSVISMKWGGERSAEGGVGKAAH